uniref:Uncharacterized protein n=1 Tax=Pipistrellus kuhlii TaxID=59472 RepID=A0A7J7YN53_PIPKU|nr:hypothetical protein mPipKuh1_010093 [Pipistrellus kuhlii]
MLAAEPPTHCRSRSSCISNRLHTLCVFETPFSHFLLRASLQSFCRWGWWEALVSVRQVGHDPPSCADRASWGRARGRGGSRKRSQLGLGITRKTSDHFPFLTSHANITSHFNVPYKTIPDIGNTWGGGGKICLEKAGV